MDDNTPIPQAEHVTARTVQGLPPHTTPTWEVELLISGIAVFAMLQLPGWLDDRYFDMLPRFDAIWQQALKFGYIYARVAAVILAGTFVLHLLLRAHWIALVGMDSVYPNGVRWDRVRMGGLQREMERTRLGSIADAIERADNRATILFAVGVYMAMQMIKLVVMVIASTLVFYALSHVVDTGDSGSLIVILILAAMLPIFLASQVDRRIGTRLAPQGRVARILRGVMSAYSAIGVGRSSMPGMLLMSSNEGYRRAFAMTLLILAGAFALTVYQLELDKNPARIGNYGLLPESARDAADMLRLEHYDDQRDSLRLGTMPFVQSQVIADAYLRLLIPIDPALHNAALHRGCPAVGATGGAPGSPLRDRAVLDCLAALHPLALDGHPLGNMHYDLGNDPKAHRPALVAMIDLRALANGRHELLVGEPNQPDGSPTPSDRIPFWR